MTIMVVGMPTELSARLAVCISASEEVWQQGWLACRDDDERGRWIEAEAEWLESRLDS
jgi:hypothetical protein